MPTPTNPSDIAREVLRLIAARRISPTPDNFRALYNEVARTTEDAEAFSISFAKQILARLPRNTVERSRLAKELEQALNSGNTDNARNALFAYLDTTLVEQPPAWNTLIGTLLQQWENSQIGWTTARKRESLERVLAANDPATLYARLQGLIRAWEKAPENPEATTSSLNLPTTSEYAAPAAAQVKVVTQAEAGEILDGLRTLLLTALEEVIPAFLGSYPELLQEAEKFAKAVKTGSTVRDLQSIGQQLHKFAYRSELSMGDSAEVQAGIMNLLRLLLENIEEIVIDNQWLHGQIETLRKIVDHPNVRMIDDAERRLKEVIYKQSQLKHNLAQAQSALKNLLADFIDQLANFTESTNTYHDRIAESAQKISQAHDIGEIGPLLDNVMNDTREIQRETIRSRDELRAARERADQAEQRIAQLQHELDETSHLMRHDQLTGALNRRGFEETFVKESARAVRRRTPLCVALLDIDNFKALNDTFGHHTGDEALIYLARIIRDNLRPEDTVARHGGEEFVLLYPDANVEQTRDALVRLQRELTRTCFLANDQHVLITFSAGVSEWQPGEPLGDAVSRADAAMYEAKQAGKNKVFISAETR